MTDTPPLGPNVRALVIERCAQMMVERAGGAGGEFGKTAAVAVRIGTSLKSDMREAFEWAQQAINIVRAAPDSAWRADEDIAGEIMRRVRDRKQT